MEKDFWIKCWEDKKIGFHQSSINRYLTEFTKVWEQGSTVFVPLCGKSMDLIWLAQQGFNVIGVELSSIAVQEFFKENQIPFTTNSTNEFETYKTSQITIYQGDFFRLDENLLKNVSYVYDRASLIALPASLREKYVLKLKQVLPKKLKDYLLITIERDENKDPNFGPPFNVPVDEVLKGFLPNYSFQLKAKDKVDDPVRGKFTNNIFNLVP